MSLKLLSMCLWDLYDLVLILGKHNLIDGYDITVDYVVKDAVKV